MKWIYTAHLGTAADLDQIYPSFNISEDYFQPLTVAVVFVHYTWTKPSTSVLPEAISVVLLLLQAVISLLSGPAGMLRAPDKI